MEVELIPVVEINYNDQELSSPHSYPSWEHSDEWDTYRSSVYRKAGFKDAMRFFKPGLPLFALEELSERNFEKLILDHTEDLRKGAYDRSSASPLSGGYVLIVDGKEKFFPQCCGELSDILYWEQLASGNASAYYQGHPCPNVKVADGKVLLDLSDERFESFIPTPEEKLITINQEALARAVLRTKEYLGHLAFPLQEINRKFNLRLPAIDDLLIWGEPS
jgi:hypothetical protein